MDDLEECLDDGEFLEQQERDLELSNLPQRGEIFSWQWGPWEEYLPSESLCTINPKSKSEKLSHPDVSDDNGNPHQLSSQVSSNLLSWSSLKLRCIRITLCSSYNKVRKWRRHHRYNNKSWYTYFHVTDNHNTLDEEKRSPGSKATDH